MQKKFKKITEMTKSKKKDGVEIRRGTLHEMVRERQDLTNMRKKRKHEKKHLTMSIGETKPVTANFAWSTMSDCQNQEAPKNENLKKIKPAAASSTWPVL